MIKRGAPSVPLSKQVARRLSSSSERKPELARDERVISTGSTLLDLAISGGVYPEGGIPPGNLVEIFGPSGCGKTVLLCEIAGAVQRQGGAVMFRDPEARLNEQFAALFGFKVENADYGRPDTVPELFAPIRTWNPTANGISGIFADSLAALSTELEMSEDGDKRGQRRAKEFSEECRKTCRILKQRGFLMVCSNQIREVTDAGPYAEKFAAPGGKAIGFYSSLRLRCHSPIKIQREIAILDKKHKRVVGVHTSIDIYKNSIWQQGGEATVSIIFDYGVDDIRDMVSFVKLITGSYAIGDRRLGNGLDQAIKAVEADGLELELKRTTIQLWHEREDKFKIERKAKIRE